MSIANSMVMEFFYILFRHKKQAKSPTESGLTVAK